MKHSVPSIKEKKLTIDEFNEWWEYMFDDGPVPKYLTKSQAVDIIKEKKAQKRANAKVTGSISSNE